MEEIDADEENRLWEEAEAKRRAEFARKIKEEAAESAKRRAEEDRLWEEAWAKKKAEVERRMREEAEALANRSPEEENRRKEEAEAKKRARRQKRQREEAEAQRRAEEKKRLKNEAEAAERIRKAEVKSNEEQKERLNKAGEAEVQRRAEQEKRREAAAVNENIGQGNVLETRAELKSNANVAYRQKFVAETNGNAEGAEPGKNTGIIKKRVLVGFAAVVLALIGIWAFSVFNKGLEEQSSPQPQIEETVVEDPVVLENTETDTPKEEEVLVKLGIGDVYEGGFVFEVDDTGKTGKIAHLDDAGPMPWKNAMDIHEQLGEGWRLPTFDELRKMHRTIGQAAGNIGEFADGLYWSATPFDDYQARLLRFRDGNTSYHYNKNVEHRKFRVRAIRDFSR